MSCHARGGYPLLKMKVMITPAIADGEALWPKRFTLKWLLERREEAGSIIFNMQYMNDCSLMEEGKVFQFKWLRFYHDAWPKEAMQIYQGVDPAISLEDRADYFALMTIGVDGQGRIYVLDYLREHLTFQRQIEAIQEKAGQFEPVKIAIEANAYQAALSQHLLEKSLLPVSPVIHRRDKWSRALALSAHFETGRVFLQEGMEELIEELTAFPQGGHDDLIDALSLAMGAALKAEPRVRLL